MIIQTSIKGSWLYGWTILHKTIIVIGDDVQRLCEKQMGTLYFSKQFDLFVFYITTVTGRKAFYIDISHYTDFACHQL